MYTVPINESILYCFFCIMYTIYNISYCIMPYHQPDQHNSNHVLASGLRMFEEKVGDQAVKAYFESMDLDVWDAARPVATVAGAWLWLVDTS